MTLWNRLRSLDPVIVSLTAVLLVFGLLMLMSASGPVAIQRTGDSLYYVKRQILNGILPGLMLFWLLAIVDYRKWKPLAFFALLASIGLLVMVYIPGIGTMHGGSRSWVQIGPVGFQPSEVVKLTYLIYLSAWLASRRNADAHDAETGILPFLGSLGAITILLVLQPDTGSMAVIVGTSLMLYLISGAPIAWFAGLFAAGCGFLALLIKLSPYRAARFMTFLHPELDPKGIGYHINQAVLAIGSGGPFGLGYGHSRQKYLYLPEVESDSISAIMAEELGYVGVLAFLAVFGWLVWRCFSIARDCKDPFGSYLAAGIGSWFAIQLLLNVGSMTGLLPITGVTLPFISHGGSSMVVLIGAMGLVAGIARTKTKRI